MDDMWGRVVGRAWCRWAERRVAMARDGCPCLRKTAALAPDEGDVRNWGTREVVFWNCRTCLIIDLVTKSSVVCMQCSGDTATSQKSQRNISWRCSTWHFLHIQEFLCKWEQAGEKTDSTSRYTCVGMWIVIFTNLADHWAFAALKEEPPISKPKKNRRMFHVVALHLMLAITSSHAAIFTARRFCRRSCFWQSATNSSLSEVSMRACTWNFTVFTVMHPATWSNRDLKRSQFLTVQQCAQLLVWQGWCCFFDELLHAKRSGLGSDLAWFS